MGRSSGESLAPGGLAAYLLGASTSEEIKAGFSPWKLRETVLRDDRAWRILAADLAGELDGLSAVDCLKTLERWDRHLAKGVHARAIL